ncbi:hypothetical protein JQ824_01125 [Brachyspira hyodysenteriae]|uniref:hypothetical protein n=1 Tax=Brachyspira hyodysenteriae TaxID=159 RepID=UPI001182E0C4|nr:hypothetical protein [Brachyspira hyodysenteriae]MBT8718780.1 hypothetical protein [Brachyspira hyodysenteriae]MBT8729037.1 hypothetical protein [Brachyspira hyodysenteriae]MBT8731604.1 hypothetical protein [Brachyspira hyodysenteriae]MBT8734186.1 hypothetical protein [Brachyspira hyodysenteriae]MBT8736782.1 hypothetical protein [Brachyspira hyodysenteriae]
MNEIFALLESEEVDKRLEALEELAKNVENSDKTTVIKALKPHILDWDENVRIKVAQVLKLYTGQ